MPRLLAFIAIGLIAGISPYVSQADTPPDLIERIEAAWTHRELTFRSFDCEWTEESLDVAGAHGRGPGMVLVPSEDKIVRTRFRFVCDGPRARVLRSGPQYNHDARDYTNYDYLGVFDGREIRKLIHSTFRDGSTGYIIEGEPLVAQLEWDTNPITLALRPLSHQLGSADLAKAKPTEQVERVGDVDCHVLRISRGPKLEEVLLVATSADHRLVRQDVVLQNAAMRKVPISVLTIDYVDDPQWSLVCSGWKQVSRDEGGQFEKSRATREFKLVINDRVDPGEFRLEFAPYTVVIHSRSKERAVVRADGTFRPTTAKERATTKSWKELAETEPAADTPPFPAVNHIPVDEPKKPD